MDEEIDDETLAAMLADDDEFELSKEKPNKKPLTFAEQADRLTAEQLVQLTCSLTDPPANKNDDLHDLIVVKPTNEQISSIQSSRFSPVKVQPVKISNTLITGSNSQSTITPSVYIDPNTHIRIGSMNLTANEIKSKLTLTKFIRLSEIDKQPSPMPTEWCTMVVLASKSDVKQASNGSTYSIWRVTDFKVTMNLFLFGDAHQSLWKTNLSSVLLVYDGDTKKVGQLSIKNQRNVCLLGVNPDLGQCKATAKSGEQCKMLVDRHACEYCVTHAHQQYKTDQNNSKKFHAGNVSRMNLQSTGSFVPKKFAEMGCAGGGGTRPAAAPRAPTKKSNEPKGAGWSEKEKSMLVMLGIEDDSLICVRSTDTKGLGDSMADVREIYQAKQAAGKVKRTIYDETKNRDDPNHFSVQIRAYPHAASTSPERAAVVTPKLIPAKVNIATSKNFVDLNKTASNEAINSAKQRAIDILKQRLAQKQITPNKSQSLVTADTSSPKRPHSDCESPSKRLKVDQQRFNEIMNMKSSHADLYHQMSLDEIFERYKKKEDIEEKLLQVMERDIKVVVCRLCHYTAYKQSVLCKQKQHYVKIVEVKQKFFECVECQKRVFTWSQYPVENCSQCHSLKGFRRTALIRQRHGAKFDDEILLLRGEERHFLDSFVGYEKLPSIVD